MNAPLGFLDLIGKWLLSEGRDVEAVEDVTANGTDWAGDTENGFYSMFDVTITYLDGDGKKRFERVEGEDMKSLWFAVVNGWPSGAADD